MKSDLTLRFKVLDQGRLASHHQNLPNPANFTSFGMEILVCSPDRGEKIRRAWRRRPVTRLVINCYNDLP